MALLEKHRSVIYAHFVETVGEEAAEAMLSQFPSRDLDEPVTKEFVALTAAELRAEMAALRTDLLSAMAEQTERLMARMQLVLGLGFTFFSALILLTR